MSLEKLLAVGVTAPVTEKDEFEGKQLRVTRSYIPSLDGLRWFAVLMVLAIHGHGLFGLGLDEVKSDPFWRFTLSGDLGVDLFFVISGFLITSILLETKERRSVTTFMIRRAIRIFPLYYLYVAVLIALSVTTAIFAAHPMPSGLEWLPFLFHFSNFALVFLGGPALEVIILWSLAIEEQFYVIWPFIVRKHDEATLLRFSLVLIVAAPVFRVAVDWAAPQTDAFYFLPFCRMDTIFVGASIALIQRRPGGRELLRRISRWLMLPAIAVVIYLLQETTYHQEPQSTWWVGYHYTCAALAFGVIVIGSLEPGIVGRSLLENPVSVYLGKISYGIYLWHPLAGRLIVDAIHQNWPGRFGSHVLFVFYVLGTCAVATVSWFAFERPILRLKKRFPYETDG